MRAHVLLCCLCLLASGGVQHFVLSYAFSVQCCDVLYDFCTKEMFGPMFYLCLLAYIVEFKRLDSMSNTTSVL